MPHLPKSSSARVSRRRVLTGAVLAGGAALALAGALAAAGPKKKMSQSAASYQDKPKGSARCDGCALFQKPAACQTVEGVISPVGWCILFAAK